MSQGWKQTKLNLGAWKSQPREGDDSEPQGKPLPSTSSTLSLKRKSPGSSSPISSPPPSSAVLPETDSNSSSSLTALDDSNTPEPSITTTSNLPITVPKSTSLSFTSSQVPSSQRIVRHGENMVTNSDEDDDSSSLEDLDDVLRLQKPTVSVVVPTTKSKNGVIGKENTRHTLGSGKTTRKVSAPPKMPNYKYSLAVLAEQQKQIQKSGVDVARVNATLEGRRHALSTERQDGEAKGPASERVLEAVMSRTGDEEEVSRLKEALRRTEALHQDPVWSFFHTNIQIDTDTPLKFPKLNDHPLQHILHDTSLQQQAFLSGYVGDYAMKNGIPDELLKWILESTYSEPREDLRLSYIRVLSDLKSHGDLLNSKFIDKSFRCVGARNEGLAIGKPVLPEIINSNDAGIIKWDRVISTLTLIKKSSSNLKSEARVHAICILCRLLLDHQVVLDCNMMTALDETLNNLIEATGERPDKAEDYQALDKVYGSVTDPRLRLQLVSYLPVYEFRTAIFRRRLALAFFYEDTKFLKMPAAEVMVDLDSIAACLQTPRFRIHRKTDYAELTSSLTLLDISIDGGDPPLPFATDKDERRFDDAVDRLCLRIKDISSQIIGVSALDMRRTEAKELLHAMQRRLTYAVRSQPYVKKSFLADAEPDYDSEKKGMLEYLNETKTGVADNPLLHTTAKGADPERVSVS